MIDKLINTISADKENHTKFRESFAEKEIASKTILLHVGEISNNIYLIKKGCLREWFNKDVYINWKVYHIPFEKYTTHQCKLVALGFT